MKISRNYAEDIEIDINDLEGEWIEQPSLYLHYSKKYSDAIYERDLRKSELDYLYAKQYNNIKNNWQEDFDKPPSESAIKEKIVESEKYRLAEKALIEATRQMNLYSGVKSSFEHRKNALSNLVYLRVSGFHSEPQNIQRMVSKRKERRVCAAQDEQRRMLNSGNRAQLIRRKNKGK